MIRMRLFEPLPLLHLASWVYTVNAIPTLTPRNLSLFTAHLQETIVGAVPIIIGLLRVNRDNPPPVAPGGYGKWQTTYLLI